VGALQQQSSSYFVVVGVSKLEQVRNPFSATAFGLTICEHIL